jgi:hypothetical protein
VNERELVEKAAQDLRDMILRVDGAVGLDLVDYLEEQVEVAYQRGYNAGWREGHHFGVER